MGGLIIGVGTINFLLRRQTDVQTMRDLLLTNIITHVFGIAADLLAIGDAALKISNIIPVQITHLFIGIGSAIYLLKIGQHNSVGNQQTP